MKVTVKDRGTSSLRERLRERLDHVAKLRCTVHDQPVVSVAIYDRENGWFDSRWTVCCDDLEQQATAIVKDRC